MTTCRSLQACLFEAATARRACGEGNTSFTFPSVDASPASMQPRCSVQAGMQRVGAFTTHVLARSPSCQNLQLHTATTARPCLHMMTNVTPPAAATPPPMHSTGYPMRPDDPDCAHYLKKGWCAFGTTCKFNHPELGTSLIAGFPAGFPAVAPSAAAAFPSAALLGGQLAQPMYPLQASSVAPAIYYMPGGQMAGVGVGMGAGVNFPSTAAASTCRLQASRQASRLPPPTALPPSAWQVARRSCCGSSRQMWASPAAMAPVP